MGLRPRVHKQEAMKGFDMQRWADWSGCRLLRFTYCSPGKLCVCCICSVYLVFEAVHRNHVHHDDIIGKRLEPRQTDAAVWKHSPETKSVKFHREEEVRS